MNITHGSNHVFITDSNNNSLLISYDTPVATIIDGKQYVAESFYSRTTSKHINKFFNQKIAEKKPESFFKKLM